MTADKCTRSATHDSADDRSYGSSILPPHLITDHGTDSCTCSGPNGPAFHGS